MKKTWIQTFTLALALAGCSSANDSRDDASDDADGQGEAVEPDAGSKRDAAMKKDSSAPNVEQTDAGDEHDDAATQDALKPDAKPVERDAGQSGEPTDAAGAAASDAPDPVCNPKPGPGGFDPSMPPPGFIPDNIVSMADGVIFTTGGGVYKVPSRGLVFGRMENGACIVTVAETGVATTVIGDGDVCINGRLVASKGKCTVDADGNKITP
jgi:hypothetical protein